MALSKVGNYCLIESTVISDFSTSNRTSSSHLYYFLENVADASGAWDYVPCARSDSTDAWAMFVSKSVSKLGHIAVIEFYTSSDGIYGCHYANVPYTLRDRILGATSRTDLTNNVGLTRRSTSGSYRDLGYGTSLADIVNSNVFVATAGLYIAYAGPDVFTFFYSGGLQDSDTAYKSITNLFVLERDNFYGGCIAKGFYIPQSASRGLNSSGVSTYTFSIVAYGANRSYSSSVADIPYLYNSTYYLTSGYIISPTYIYIFDNPTSQLYKLDWLLITSTNVEEDTLSYNNITYKPLGIVRYYYADAKALCKIYLRVDPQLPER